MAVTLTIALSDEAHDNAQRLMRLGGFQTMADYIAHLIAEAAAADPLSGMADRIRQQMQATDDEWLNDEQLFRRLIDGG